MTNTVDASFNEEVTAKAAESGAAESEAGVEEAAEPRAALSHQSAAAVHGLEMLSPTLTRVHSTTVGGTGFRTATHHRHVATLSDDELVEVTPKSIRLRKGILDPNERKRSQKQKAEVA